MRQSIGPIHSLFTGFTGLKAIVEMTDPTLKGLRFDLQGNNPGRRRTETSMRMSHTTSGWILLRDHG